MVTILGTNGNLCDILSMYLQLVVENFVAILVTDMLNAFNVINFICQHMQLMFNLGVYTAFIFKYVYYELSLCILI